MSTPMQIEDALRRSGVGPEPKPAAPAPVDNSKFFKPVVPLTPEASAAKQRKLIELLRSRQ